MNVMNASPHAGPRERPRDPGLDTLVDIANRSHVPLGITLFVHGLVITGEMISERQYFAEQVETVARLLEPAGVAVGTAEGSRAGAPRSPGEGGRRQEDAPLEEPGEPEFVHLRNARLLTGGTIVPTGGSGFLWRGRVSAVDGYSVTVTGDTPRG
jgi:hypothetical protein